MDPTTMNEKETSETKYNCQGCDFIDTDEMVQCDTCNGWYHYSCAGPNITHDIANYSWDCHRCEIEQFSTPERSVNPTTAHNVTSILQLAESKISMSAESKQRLALEYMEEKRKLEEEQMNKRFEIQRRYLEEKFKVLNLVEHDEKYVAKEVQVSGETSSRTSSVGVRNESVEVWLDDQAKNPKRIRFQNLYAVNKSLLTPARVPSTLVERTTQQQMIEQVSPVPQKTLTHQSLQQQMNMKSDASSSVKEETEQDKYLFQSTHLQRHQDKESFGPSFSSPNRRLSFPLGSTIQSKQQSRPIIQSLGSQHQQSDYQEEQKFIPRLSSTAQDQSPTIPFGSTIQTEFHRNLSEQDVVKSQLNPTITGSNIIPQEITSLGQQQAKVISATLSPSQIAARHVLPRDLPKFQGNPQEWPMFISSYESSTLTGGYTNAENLIRLQRCLQGKALEAVRSILLSPNNVASVIETLRMMYGRPDLIIHTLIQQIRDEQPPRLERLETIINYALAVRNLCSVIKATHLEAHMNNPYLMQEITDKLPSTMRLDWSRHKRTLPTATMENLGNWLYDVAQAASDVVTPAVEEVML